MNPQEAHQIANPEILTILEDIKRIRTKYTGKGCGYVYVSMGGSKVKCGTLDDTRNDFSKNLLCDECFYNLTRQNSLGDNKEYKLDIEKLRIFLIAQEKELNFLNEISKWHEEFSVAYIKMVDKRREALEISCEDLRRVLK